MIHDIIELVASGMASTPARRLERRRAADGQALVRGCAGRDLSAAPAVLNLVESRTAAARARPRRCSPLSPPRSAARPRARRRGHGPAGGRQVVAVLEAGAGWRSRRRTVAVLAVDPSSRRCGGSLLGDRARIERDPADAASSSARPPPASASAASPRPRGRRPLHSPAAFDVVVIETVGVGQSETEVADVADTVAVVVQPGSGDVLQFLKSGIMEIPDVLVVTKADLGPVADPRRWPTSVPRLRALGCPRDAVVAVSSVAPAGRHRRARRHARRASARAWTCPPGASAPAACTRLADFARRARRAGRARARRTARGRALADRPGRRPRRRRAAARSGAPGATRDRYPEPRIILPAEPLVDGDTALRSWRDADLPSLVAACQDPEIIRWTRVPAGLRGRPMPAPTCASATTPPSPG